MSIFNQLNPSAKRVLFNAQSEARQQRFGQIMTPHLLVGLALEGRNELSNQLSAAGITVDSLRAETIKIAPKRTDHAGIQVPPSPAVSDLLKQASNLAQERGEDLTRPDDIAFFLLGDDLSRQVMTALGLDPDDLLDQLQPALNEGESKQAVAVAAGGSRSRAGRSNKLAEFSRNLSVLATEGLLDPFIGRQRELERLLQILARRRKNNVVLVGEPGVGKRAIVSGLAQMIAAAQVPDFLLERQLVELDMGLLLAGSKYRGEFEGRLKAIVSEAITKKTLILVIPDIHTLVGAGAPEGGMDAANMLKQPLARGELQCIGYTDLDHYRQYFERDAALERRFQPIMISEPSQRETVEILQALRPVFEAHHGVGIPDVVIEEAVSLADRYINDRCLPDKAVDLVDEAASRCSLSRSAVKGESQEMKAFRKELAAVRKRKFQAARKNEMSEAASLRRREQELLYIVGAAQALSVETLREVTSSWTSVPIGKMDLAEQTQLLEMSDRIHDRVIGQDAAVLAVCRAIRRARVGLKNPNRPIGGFIFSGPTGVGKTELVKALAEYLFQDEDAVVRLDMSEYMERHSVSNLIGAPPSYIGYEEGGILTEAIRRKPYSIVLFDEIEKAHPDVFNLLLQILEDGRLTDSRGKTVDFKNTLLVMTSNLGAKAIEKGGSTFGFALSQSSKDAYQVMRSQAIEALRQHFRPEFLNRVDEVIVFSHLSKGEISEVLDVLLADLGRRLADKRMSLILSENARALIISQGWNPSYGARPLRRALQRLVEDALAETILMGKVADGDCLLGDLAEDGESLRFTNHAC